MFMKSIIIAGIIAGSFLAAGCGRNSSSNSSSPPPTVEPGINFNGVDPQQALSIYAVLSRCELISDSHVKSIHTPIVLHNSNLSNGEMMASLEKALAEQAGIVITRLDDQRASVTFNDALPTKNTK
jgi:hypothetical protein